MARAHSIFIVRHRNNLSLIGAWTVKRELSEWYQTHHEKKLLEQMYMVHRTVDGKADLGSSVMWREL